jgi:surfeit locus 1 family protein
MKLGKWQFTPHSWPTIGAIVLIAGFGWLASWQFHRAGEKRALVEAIHVGATAPPVNLNAAVRKGRVGQIARYRHVALHGRYDAAHQILVSEIMHDSRRGYYVLTPFHLAGADAWVIVNRGWLPDTGKPVPQAKLAVPERRRKLAGLWTRLPRPGIRLGSGARVPRGWPKTMLYPTHKQLAQVLDRPLLARAIWLSPHAAAGFERDWHLEPHFGPRRHIGYAFQWMALAATVFFVWVVLNLHKTADDEQA